MNRIERWNVFTSLNLRIRSVPATEPFFPVKSINSKFISKTIKLGKTVGSLAVVFSAGTLFAGTIFVPNGSFETPATPFAGPEMDSWQKAPQPFWFPPTNNWDQVVGQFLNTPEGNPGHITNMDGSQAAFMFAVPDAGIFQDFNTISGTNTSSKHDFLAQYEAGKSYTLSVGVLGNGGGMQEGVMLKLSLYYRDISSNIVTIGETIITNSAELFPTNTYFTDFQVRLPKVQASDAWAGKRVGIQIASLANFVNQGGYWDIDNVRLTESVVPNYSFEEPKTPFAGPEMDAWQKSPMPFWFPPTSSWDQVMGQFLNPPAGSPGHIDNVEGNQAAFIFALPDAYIFQDFNSVGGTNTTPSHDFNAKFEVGRSYALTVGVLGGGGGMSNGVTFELSLYYRDASSNMVTVAATTITNSAELFPTNTHLTDFQVLLPTVRTGQPWAGKNIGIKLASQANFLNQGGYWDIDNVRLVESLVPNNSFESPETPFAGPEMDAWQKTPKPFWFPDATTWDQLVGQFLNTPAGSSSHITNMDGKQGAFLFALPEVAIFQDYTTIYGTNATPAHDMIAQYEVGKSYSLTVGVLGGGGGMSNGVPLEISLYYRDGSNNRVNVSATTVTNNSTVFPTNTYFTDFQVVVPAVKSTDAWAGKYIGVQIASKADFSNQGGYWDLDNVRLQSVRDPIIKGSAFSGGQFQLTLASAPGRLEILATTNLAAPMSTWTSLGTVTNVNGNILFTNSSVLSHRFFGARQVP